MYLKLLLICGNYFFRFPRDNFWIRTIVKDYEFAKFISGKTDFNTVKLELLYDNGRPYSMHKKIEGTPLAEKMNELYTAGVLDIFMENNIKIGWKLFKNIIEMKKRITFC